MSMTNRVWPDVATAPGETLAEELESRGMSQTELARQMERPVQAINEIINGGKAITAETALQLEEVLGIPGNFWVRLEADYRYNKARLAGGKRKVPSMSGETIGRLSDVAESGVAARAQAVGHTLGRRIFRKDRAAGSTRSKEQRSTPKRTASRSRTRSR